MNKRHKERLMKLADTLRGVPTKLFDLDSITYIPIDYSNSEYTNPSYTTDWDKYKKDQNKIFQALVKKEPDCGATACAIGWCPATFPRTFEWDKFGDVTLKSNNDLGAFEAAQEFFGLTEEQSQYLFMPDAYHESKRGPKSVASRIEAFVKRDGVLSKQFLETYNF